MKINQIPDIYIEQYLLNELPENLREEMNALIQENPSLEKRIEEIKKSNENILAAHTSESIISAIMEKINRVKSDSELIHESKYQLVNETAPDTETGPVYSIVKNVSKKIRSLTANRYTLSLASAAVIVIAVLIMMPGILKNDSFKTEYDTDVRIKGLDSKLIIYRMKGKEIEELKSSDTAREGEILQLGYIATDKFRYGTIISIDGRGTVTLHYPENSDSHDVLTMNKKVLLNKSYELDDSPSFERFIMILSDEPVDTSGIIKKAKKLAMNKDTSLNGSIGTGKHSVEFSAVIKKIE